MCQSNKPELEIKKKLEVKQGSNQKSGGPWSTQASVESPLAGKILENKESCHRNNYNERKIFNNGVIFLKPPTVHKTLRK